MHGDPLIADHGFAGADCEALVDSLGASFLRPDRQDERRRHGSLGAIRPSSASVFATLKGQPSLKRHGAHTVPGLVVRIASDDSPWPPSAGTTGNSVTPAATSSPTTTNNSAN